jgi:integrase
MKMRRDHVVPLSRQALALFHELRAKTGKQVHVFHSPSSKLKYLSEGAGRVCQALWLRHS